MPEEPEWLAEIGVELEHPTSRFTLHPAIAIAVPESDWNFDNSRLESGPKESLGKYFGDWIYEEQNGLGRGTPEAGSTGRGAGGIAAILVFVGVHAAGGVVSAAAATAFKRFVERARDSLEGDDAPGFQVSRGAAAYLALAEIAERFGERGDLEIEAVEEPSAIAGRPVTELSYVGLEPWIVLVRNRDRAKRYVVVVASVGGDVLGALETPMGEFEYVFLPSPGESEWAGPPRRRRRRWKFWK